MPSIFPVVTKNATEDVQFLAVESRHFIGKGKFNNQVLRLEWTESP